MDDDNEDTIQGQLTNMMSFMSEGFQALQLNMDEIHIQCHGYDKRLNGLSSMVTTLNTCHSTSH